MIRKRPWPAARTTFDRGHHQATIEPIGQHSGHWSKDHGREENARISRLVSVLACLKTVMLDDLAHPEQEREVDHVACGHGKRLSSPQAQEREIMEERSVRLSRRQLDIRMRALRFQIPGAIGFWFRQNVGFLLDSGAHTPDSASGDGTAAEDGSSAVDGSPRSMN